MEFAEIIMPAKPAKEVQFQFGPWSITSLKSHIMTSEEAEKLSGAGLELPHTPDMLFANNKLEISHESGAKLQFLPLEALRLVNAHEDLIRVSYAEAWLASRQESPHLNNIVRPYDWTYTTSYKGVERCTVLRLFCL